MHIKPLAQKPAQTLAEYLNSLFINYMIYELPDTQDIKEAIKTLGIQAHEMLRSVLLEDNLGQVVAVLPENYFMDYNLLCKKLDRDLKLSLDEKILFPLPEMLGVQGIIEEAVYHYETIYFLDKQANAIIGMKQEEFRKFLQHSTHESFSIPVDDLFCAHLPEQKIADIIKQLTPVRIKQRIGETFELPAIPVIAAKILKLRFDPNATAEQLAAIIQTDPSLSAQLMNWARSAFYGFKGRIDSLEAAIVKVLGFDVVMELSLGIALSRTMRVPIEGPLGLRRYWPFSVFSAILVEKLAMKMPAGMRPQRGLAYLSGLLHNFGHLILGQLFPPHFELLNRYIEVNPNVELLQIEHYVLGVGHDQIGAWLIDAWNLPGEIVAAANFHHLEQFSSNYAIYPTLVYISDRLLKRSNMGDAASCEIPNEVLERVSLRPEAVEDAYNEIMAKEAEILSMADELLAIVTKS